VVVAEHFIPVLANPEAAAAEQALTLPDNKVADLPAKETLAAPAMAVPLVV
jgi:hypothetical protein